MAGVKGRSGGARPGSGGARPGAGRKPVEKTIFARDFVGPPTPKRERRSYSSEDERAEARRLRDRKKYEKRRAELIKLREDRAKNECLAAGIEYEKFARKTRHSLACMMCGCGFIAKLSSAKYCSQECRSRFSNNSPYKRERLENDPVFRSALRIRALIRSAIRQRGYTKTSKSAQILGCSWGEFAVHIERQFTAGMKWELMGKEIHIDHIIPLASARSYEDLIMLNHFTNLRPLWAADNLSKRDKIIFLI